MVSKMAVIDNYYKCSPGYAITLINVLKPQCYPYVSGVSFLNELQDQLKDLVFHLHLKHGKTVKTASLDLSGAKKDL